MSESSTNQSLESKISFYKVNESLISKDVYVSGATNLFGLGIRDDKTDFFAKKIELYEKESNVDIKEYRTELLPKKIEPFTEEISEVKSFYNFMISKAVDKVNNFQIKKFDLTFSSEIKYNLINDQYLWKFITIIEEKLRELAKNFNLILESKIDYEEDWETPGLNKIILFINFKNISFDEKLELWSKFSILIRETIKRRSYINKYQLKDFLNKFYIKIDIN